MACDDDINSVHKLIHSCHATQISTNKKLQIQSFCAILWPKPHPLISDSWIIELLTANACPDWKLLKVPEMELLQSDRSALNVYSCEGRKKCPIRCLPCCFSHNSHHVHSALCLNLPPPPHTHTHTQPSSPSTLFILSASAELISTVHQLTLSWWNLTTWNLSFGLMMCPGSIQGCRERGMRGFERTPPFHIA